MARNPGVPTDTVIYPPDWWVRRQAKRIRRNMARQQEQKAIERARHEAEMKQYRAGSQALRKKPPAT